jgi:glycosyltransferase involved in cell wall biosynthesis
MLHYYFPPIGGMGSVRAAKLAAHLPAAGWVPTVVAPRHATHHEDPSLVASDVTVVRTAQLARRAGAVGPVPTPAAGAQSRPLAAQLRAWTHRWLYRPDAQIGWYGFALAAARRVLRRERADVLFSSSNPLTAHLVARRLHRETGLPWVAEFRDLWTDWDTGGWRARRDGALERGLLADATAVVTVSPTYADALRRRGARHVSVVTNGFDPAEMPSLRPDTGATVAYLGTFYPERQDLRTPFAALARLVRSGELPDLRVRVIGDFTPALAAVVDACGLGQHVEPLGFLPHAASLAALARAGLLLLAGPTTRDAAVLAGNVAGKTFEYLGVGRPILHVGAPESDLARMLRPFQHVQTVAPGDVDGAERAVRVLLRGPAEPAPQPELDAFTHRALAGRLAAVLAEACGTREAVAC